MPTPTPVVDAPCDFLTHLEERLKKDRRAAAELLGEWLASYERAEPRLARTSQSLEEHAQAS